MRQLAKAPPSHTVPHGSVTTLSGHTALSGVKVTASACFTFLVITHDNIHLCITVDLLGRCPWQKNYYFASVIYGKGLQLP